MTGLLGGFMVSQALYAAAKLDLLTQLDERPLSSTELAARVGADPDALRRLIRVLAPVGVFSTDGDRVTATALGSTLSRHHPQSVYELACFWMETSYLPFSEFCATLQTGEPGAVRYLGMPYVDWVTGDPQRAAQLGRTFAAIGAGLRPAFFDEFRLPPGDVVADIGGADGSNLIEILRRHPDRRGVLLDLPDVVVGARAAVSRADLDDRVKVVAGDFFVEVPAADMYLLSTVLHDWDDAHCRAILSCVAAAAQPGASLVVIEGLVAAGDGPDPTKLSDLMMLGVVGGRERTAAEFTALLESAGFAVRRVVPSGGPYSVIEAGLAEPDGSHAV